MIQTGVSRRVGFTIVETLDAPRVKFAEVPFVATYLVTMAIPKQRFIAWLAIQDFCLLGREYKNGGIKVKCYVSFVDDVLKGELTCSSNVDLVCGFGRRC